MSGRGLGHTGGTLDKMESIQGWQAEVSDKQMMEMLGPNGPGAVICAASADLAPADKKLYALRDVTATVDCIPLIASSIMSKKIAEGTGSLVLEGPDPGTCACGDHGRPRQRCRSPDICTVDQYVDPSGADDRQRPRSAGVH